MRIRLSLLMLLACQTLLPQLRSLEVFLSDSSMKYASVSFKLIDGTEGTTLHELNPGRNVIPASVLKLVTASAALELLGPDHTFTTSIGYNGVLSMRTGVLNGNIIIRGGGDPALGSEEFGDHYKNFAENWIAEIQNTGIEKIKGKVICDDSYFDHQPVPGKWLWEDAGNYYGAGAYGLSVYDNTYEIHIRTSADGKNHEITSVLPEECNYNLTDMLNVAGDEDEGYVYAAPYSSSGWMAGTIPAGQEDFILKASITDPPLLMARIIDKKLRESGIKVSGEPTTSRLDQRSTDGFVRISELSSPPLSEMINTLNHESINLYAEHFVKEVGRKFMNIGSTDSGLVVIHKFLNDAGIDAKGIFMEDGSGLSPLNSVNASAITNLLLFMKNESRYRDDFLSSLPDAGKEGTLKNYFRDDVFEDRLSAKSGSMTRVRGYAGYLKAVSGKNLIFCIIVNNFKGPSGSIIAHIEEILKEIIITN